jgi:hypothetical protein
MRYTAHSDGVLSLDNATVNIDRNITWGNRGSGVVIRHEGGDVATRRDFVYGCRPSDERRRCLALWAKVDGNHTRDKTTFLIRRMFQNASVYEERRDPALDLVSDVALALCEACRYGCLESCGEHVTSYMCVQRIITQANDFS